MWATFLHSDILLNQELARPASILSQSPATQTWRRKHNNKQLYPDSLVYFNGGKFASVIKNINFGFINTPMCVSTVYTLSTFPRSSVKKRRKKTPSKQKTGILLGLDLNQRMSGYVIKPHLIPCRQCCNVIQTNFTCSLAWIKTVFPTYSNIAPSGQKLKSDIICWIQM